MQNQNKLLKENSTVILDSNAAINNNDELSTKSVESVIKTGMNLKKEPSKNNMQHDDTSSVASSTNSSLSSSYTNQSDASSYTYSDDSLSEQVQLRDSAPTIREA